MKEKTDNPISIAFTLIELMVVVTIIGVLANVVVPLIMKAGNAMGGCQVGWLWSECEEISTLWDPARQLCPAHSPPFIH